MSERKILHFALGPVQGFIADARRTRDLWAGSFLLSWLSGQAMAALQEKGGRIVFPEVIGDPLFEAITGTPSKETKDRTPFIGSLPNRFKADVTDLCSGLEAGPLCRDAVLAAWKRVGDAVYHDFIREAAAALGKDTEDIWRRQTAQFWDMVWVEGWSADGDDLDEEWRPDSDWLEQRKNWRTDCGGKEAAQPGDLCRLMGRYQEISGYQRIGEHRKQQAFWQALAARVGGSGLDLQADERLCAIALIKRLFPRLKDIGEVIGWQPGSDNMDIVHWPSVSYIAAIPWLKAADDRLAHSDQSDYWLAADKNLKGRFMSEASTRAFGLSKNGIFKLDGQLLHQDGIATWPLDDLAGDDDRAREAARQRLSQGLRTVQKQLDAEASEFYAVLLMDGDRIGDRLNQAPEAVKKGLSSFTALVKDAFGGENEASGVLIYAGGDDVLALVPVDTALRAARHLRGLYREAFEKALGEYPSRRCKLSDFTMSASVVCAQYKIPFRRVLSQAHHYLDEVAKERNGRDSLAVAVVKPGGIAFDWVSAWTGGADEPGGEDGPVQALDDLAAQLNRERHIPSGLFYNLKARYGPLFDEGRRDGDDRQSAESHEIFGDEELMRALLRAELVSSGKEFGNGEKVIGQLLKIGKPIRRREGAAQAAVRYDFDSALVARFLSIEGRWRMTGGDKT